MRALVVDDSVVSRHFMRAILNTLGYEVAEAENGVQALEVLDSDREIELALVDWNMPNMDGLEFVKRVRSSEQLEHLRMVMVTSESDLEKVRSALAGGADEYVMKPFDRASLVGKLELIRGGNALGVSSHR